MVARVPRAALTRLLKVISGADYQQPARALQRARRTPGAAPMKLTSNADAVARRVAQWSDHVTPSLARATLQAATVLTESAKREAPVKTGRLRRSIGYVAGGQLRYIVSPNVPYAAAVHGGTRPRVIVPTNKRALWWKGARHPVRRVNHPGTRGNPFMARALDRSEPRIRQIAADAGASIVTTRG